MYKSKKWFKKLNIQKNLACLKEGEKLKVALNAEKILIKKFKMY